MELRRRKLLSVAAGAVSTGALAGCLGDGTGEAGSDGAGPVVQASFFVFGDVVSHVAGDAAADNLLVPVGQHGHGWEPGPRVREDIRTADLFVHGMDGFQPWADDIRGDLEADGSDVETVDISAGIDMLAIGGGHDHDDGDDEHDGEGADDEASASGQDRQMDPHFWMDPVRITEAASTVQTALADVDPDNEQAYTENSEAFQSELDDLHQQLDSTISAGSRDVLLVAGHDSFQYLRDRYGIEVEALTNVSPDDRPTPRDIERAQEVIQTHDLRYICADPLESQQAAEQLVAETDAEEVLPLTAMPGLTDEWRENDWGYVEVMENVNLPTLEDALGA